MKKTLCALLALLMLISSALCEELVVYNCDQWVSMREKPDTSSARLVKVPLGATVHACEYLGDFVLCTYGGARGYILSEYLSVLDYDGTNILGYDEFLNEDTGLQIEATERRVDFLQYEVSAWKNDKQLWQRYFYAPDGGDARGFAIEYGFNSGNVYVMSTGEGLFCINGADGRILWFVSTDALGTGEGESELSETEDGVTLTRGESRVFLRLDGTIIDIFPIGIS